MATSFIVGAIVYALTGSVRLGLATFVGLTLLYWLSGVAIEMVKAAQQDERRW